MFGKTHCSPRTSVVLATSAVRVFRRPRFFESDPDDEVLSNAICACDRELAQMAFVFAVN